MSIILSGVSFRYQQQTLFEDVSLSVTAGAKVSVVGNNGTGKSTLLKLVAGEFGASSGSIHCTSAPWYVPQQVGVRGISVGRALGVDAKLEALHAICNGSGDSVHYDILADDWEVESRCRAALGSWGLPDVDLAASVDSLSGGEKTKLFLAGISVHRPAIVLLDEPTNHLDAAGRRQLYDFIADTRATVLVVSHDIALLNLMEATCELTPGGLRLYGGNYEFYKVCKETEHQALDRQVEAEETALRLARRKAQEVRERQEKRSRRGERNKAELPRAMRKKAKDDGERTSMRLQGKHAEIVGENRRRLGELRLKQPAACALKLDFDDARLHDGKLLVSARGVNFGYGAEGLLWENPLDIEIRSGERIHLAGDNGSGKTTLLKLLTGELRPTIGEVQSAGFSHVCLDQEYSRVETPQSVLELAQEHNRLNLSDHEVKLRLHRALFSKEVWDKPCNVLSGGERMRLYLCCLMISDHVPDLFLLDEPTNNLDLQSLAILTATIRDYRGTLLVISHDAKFVEDIGVTREVGLEARRR